MRRERERGVDEPDVRERLREVAQHATGDGIVLLRQQPNIVAEREQPLEQLARLGFSPHERVVVGQPEAAGQKRPFTRRQAIVGFAGAVALDEAALDELALNRAYGADDAWVGRRQEADQ